MRKLKKQAGLTIIEVMLVCAIIGVLAAIVMPSVRSYAVRAKMSEALLGLATCKNTITELYQSLGDPPADGEWGCEQDNVSQYISLVTTKDLGTVVAVLRGFNDGRLDAHVVTLTPLDGSGALSTGSGFQIRRWRCGFGPDGTDVLPQYLPNSCRG